MDTAIPNDDGTDLRLRSAAGVSEAAAVSGPVGSITVRPEGDGSSVSLWGEIDGALRDVAGRAMVEVVARGGPTVIDTADVTFIDSTGLAFLVQLYRLGEETGHPCSLRNPVPMVLEMLDVLGMGGRMRVETAQVP